MTGFQIQREPDMRVFTGHDINRLFVYGTLKKTFGLHPYIRDGKFVGEDTLKGYLFGPGHRGFPAFVPDDRGMEIKGEVYEWPQDKFGQILADCDRIEGVPHHYWRLPFLSQQRRFVWAYWQPPENIRGTWQIMYTGRFIGHTTPVCDFQAFLTSNPQHRWPAKPRMRFQQEAKCLVVDQNDLVGTSPYSPAGSAVPATVVSNLLPAPQAPVPEEKLVKTTSMGKVSNGN